MNLSCPGPKHFSELKPGNSFTALSSLLHTPWRDSQWGQGTGWKSNHLNNPISPSLHLPKATLKISVCNAMAESQIQKRSNYDPREKWKYLHLKKKLTGTILAGGKERWKGHYLPALSHCHSSVLLYSEQIFLLPACLLCESRAPHRSGWAHSSSAWLEF